VRLLSVVIPVFNEEANLRLLHERLTAVGRTLDGMTLEIIFVDDHSVDRTPETIAELMTQDPRVKTIRLSRNFGSHAAIRAGLDRCAGDAACVIAADLQDPPEFISHLLDALDAGADIVWGCAESRQDPVAEVFFSRIYYRLLALVLPNNWKGGADVFLVNRKALDAVNRLREKNTNFFALLLWSGFRQATVAYRAAARPAGAGKWRFSAKLKLFADSFASFSVFPIRLVSFSGLALLLAAAVFAVARAIGGGPADRPSDLGGLTCLVLALSGIQLTMLGIVAEYLWRAFDEGRSRPLYIVEETRGFKE
jgi:dolichol-phosphate mannosyltransferase